MTTHRVGYARVSTGPQNLDSQTDALKAAGCERIFTDKASGKLAKRPALEACFEFLREGDTLVITRLSRLGRSLKNLLELADKLRERGVDLVVLEQNIDTTTSTGRLLFHLMASFDEYMRELIVENSKEGVAAATARGVKNGRKPALTPEKVALARDLHAGGKYTVGQIAQHLGVSRPTIYRALEISK